MYREELRSVRQGTGIGKGTFVFSKQLTKMTLIPALKCSYLWKLFHKVIIAKIIIYRTL